MCYESENINLEFKTHFFQQRYFGLRNKAKNYHKLSPKHVAIIHMSYFIRLSFLSLCVCKFLNGGDTLKKILPLLPRISIVALEKIIPKR